MISTLKATDSDLRLQYTPDTPALHRKNTLAALLTRREFFGPSPNENPQALLKESLG